MDPFDTSYTDELLIVTIGITISALFALAETAIAPLGTLRARQILDSQGRAVRPLNLWLTQPQRVLTTILIYKNLFHVLTATCVAKLMYQSFQSTTVSLATGLSTLLILIFGEIIPRSLAKSYGEKLAIPSLIAIYGIYSATAPLVWVFTELSNQLLTWAGGVDKAKPPITEEELEFLVNVGERAGVLEETKKDMLVGVFEFDETMVREIMTPRPDVRWIPVDASLDEVLSIVVESGMSRIPVCSIDGIDHIVGILLVKDLLRVLRDLEPKSGSFKVKQVMREPFFIPESKPIVEVFKELKSTKNHIAIVIDEHGGTAGLVTMEDILEEIVGDIQDEYDAEEAEIVETGIDSFDIAGSCNIDEFLDYFQLDETVLKDRPEDGIDTISGWITSVLGEIPEVGKTVTIGPLTIKVSEMEKHRIKRVQVSRLIPQEAGPTN